VVTDAQRGYEFLSTAEPAVGMALGNPT